MAMWACGARMRAKVIEHGGSGQHLSGGQAADGGVCGAGAGSCSFADLS